MRPSLLHRRRAHENFYGHRGRVPDCAGPQMKLIFLDIDGVLINRESCMKGFGEVYPPAVAELNRLIENTDAAIVVSSCWRIGRSVPDLRELLGTWGVRARVIDKTPNHPDGVRGGEIQEWLTEYQKHRYVESFVILDDDQDMEELLPRLVHTNFETGLTAADCAKAKELLK